MPRASSYQGLTMPAVNFLYALKNDNASTEIESKSLRKFWWPAKPSPFAVGRGQKVVSHCLQVGLVKKFRPFYLWAAGSQKHWPFQYGLPGCLPALLYRPSWCDMPHESIPVFLSNSSCYKPSPAENRCRHKRFCIGVRKTFNGHPPLPVIA